MEKTHLEKNKYFLIMLVVSILVISFILRSYQLAALFPFTMDEEYQAFLVKNIIINKHIPLIGVNVGGTGLYLGPFFTWFSVVPYYLGQLQPLSTAWMAAGIGSLTAAIIFILTKKYFNSVIPAGIVALLFAVNPLINAYGRKYWNPTFVPLLAVAWFYSLLFAKQNPKWLWVTALVFGLALHTHYSLLALIIPTLFWLYQSRIKLPITRKVTIGSLVILCLTLAPLVVFELRHQFIMLKGLFSQLSQLVIPAQMNLSNLILANLSLFGHLLDRLIYFGFNRDLAAEITNCATLTKSMPPVSLSILFIGLIYLIKRKNIYPDLINLILYSYVTFLAITLLSPNLLVEYYYLPLLPLGIFLIGLVFYDNHQNPLAILVLIGILVMWTFQSLTFSNHQGLNMKTKILSYIKNQVSNQPYDLEVIGDCFKYEGWRYLAEADGITPNNSYMDQYFNWLYTEKHSLNSLYQVVLYPEQPDQKKILEQRWQHYLQQDYKWHLKTKIGTIQLLVAQKREDS